MARRNEGHILERGKWADGKTSYRLSWKLPPETDRKTGKVSRRYGYKTVRCGAIKEAREQLRKILVSLDNGSYVQPATVTVGTLCEDWLEAQKGMQKLRANTYEGYRLHLEKYVIPRIGAIVAQRLTTDAVEKLYRDLLSDGATQRKVTPGLSARTILHIHRNLRQVLAWAVRHKVLASNPTDGAERPTVNEPEGEDGGEAVKALTGDQLAAILSAFDTTPLGPLVRLAARTGMRRGELLALRWSDVDLEARTLRVARTIVDADGSLAFASPKTKRSKRTIVLDTDAVSELSTYWKSQAEGALRAGINPRRGSTELVFPADLRDPTSPRNPRATSKAFVARAAALGFLGCGLHTLRHTHASLLLRAGADLKTVSQRLGHANAAITLNIYQSVLPGMQEHVASIVERLLASKR